jgi:hypothetical protein
MEPNRARSALIPLLVTCGAAWAQEPTDLTAAMTFKAAKEWSIVLPRETWTKVDGGIPIPHANAERFATESDGKSLSLGVDTDGDGSVDKRIKGAKGYLELGARTADGKALEYALRLRAVGTAYEFATAGVMRGRLCGETIVLIDQNNNGVWNEFGVDAMVVGSGKAASFLSKVANLGGSLYELAVDADGREVRATKWAGDSGELDLRKGFKARGKLDSVVVTSQNGSMSFELSQGALRVPAGTYKIAGGQASSGVETVRIGGGRMNGVAVKSGETTALDWGGPLVAEFAFAREGEVVKIEPAALHFFGAAGEEYLEFLPQGASPKFNVFDAKSQKLLKSGRFGGC